MRRSLQVVWRPPSDIEPPRQPALLAVLEALPRRHQDRSGRRAWSSIDAIERAEGVTGP